MAKKLNGGCSVIIVGRDKYSPTAKCIESVLAHTKEADEIIVVLGGAPKSVQEDLTGRFNSNIHFIFKPNFLNPAQGRNVGLKAAKNKLAVLMDNDVYVREGWLKHLLDCQKKTNAVMVVPIVLEEENAIHCAGNEFYITYKNGKAFGYKELPYNGYYLGEGTNLKRQPVDYGELHCQLVKVEPTIRLKAFDEKIQEVGECDSALTWAKAGHKMYLEPKSVVYYHLYHPVQYEDIHYFIWRWDMRTILKGYEHFEKKWGIDITEHGHFQEFLLQYNSKIGFLTRMFPCKFTFYSDKVIAKAIRVVGKLWEKLFTPWEHFLKERLGYYEWPKYAD